MAQRIHKVVNDKEYARLLEYFENQVLSDTTKFKLKIRKVVVQREEKAATSRELWVR